MAQRIEKTEALSFLLTYLVVEQQMSFEMNQYNLFRLTTMAAEAELQINGQDGIIPHEIIESIAADFLNEQKQHDST